MFLVTVDNLKFLRKIVEIAEEANMLQKRSQLPSRELNKVNLNINLNVYTKFFFTRHCLFYQNHLVSRSVFRTS